MKLITLSKQKTGLLMLVVLAASTVTPAAFARDFWDKPAVKQGVVGAAAGAAIGGLSDRSTVGKGAVTGAAVGVGTGLLTQSKTLRDNPLIRRSAQGAVIGAGASYATGRSAGSGAVLGAGGGAGYHFLKQYLDKR